MLVMLKMEHALDVGIMVWAFATSKGRVENNEAMLPRCLPFQSLTLHHYV